MKTSRISRDTTRIINSLSSGRPTRRSLRQFGQYVHASDPSTFATDVKSTTAATSDRDASSELSSAPSSPAISESEFEGDGDEENVSPSGSRKRKRGKPAAKSTHIKTETSTPALTSKSARDPASKPPRKARRQPAKHIKVENGTSTEIKIEPPANWEQMYSLTAEMRKRVLAPVDTMGCESLAEEHRSPKDQRLQTLISLMLSSQTKDTINAVAMRNLQTQLPGGLTLQSLLDVEPDLLNNLIWQVGFHNNKTRFIKATAEILRDSFAGDIPDTIEGLISLPGVGPKMAYLCMSAAWGRDEGIGVDVHVHRITNLWGWHKTRTPEETRMTLQEWLPRDKWHDINHLLVGFGQTICLPIGRKCGSCTLAVEGLCPAAVVKKEVVVKGKRRTVKKEEDDQDQDAVEVKEEKELLIKEEKADESAPGLDVPLIGTGTTTGAALENTLPDMEDIGTSRRSSRRSK
ncbi:hypothetical protein AAFC00_004813 [Neodothiora populina]|uniref:Endonuclease III homolog n=1 Tax=Neodothiora populina TaxID=2781224 RepID=A0ABR3P3A4_9PEZI